ncbi:MAG: SDR family NAD(P)-dependent oxidoreductase [Myxococcota bacterium]
MGYFTGKRVFLVGGSEGIGRSTAVALAGEGAHVVVAARRTEPLEETVAAMREASRSEQVLGFHSVDVTDRASVKASVEPVTTQLGGLDVLVTNVGAARPGYVSELSDDDYDQMVAVNYMGHANVVRAYLPYLRSDVPGHRADICLVSSALGFMSMPGYSAYSASKFALAGFAESLRMEVATDGVRVSLFYPGTTDTPGLKSENDAKPAAVWKMEADSAFSKTHAPDDVARSILRAIERGRFENFPGSDVWFIWFMYKHFPGLSRYLADQEWLTALKKVASDEGRTARSAE